MKNRFKILAISLTLGLFIGMSNIAIPQPPPPPPEHGSGTNMPAGGAAPIDGGLIFLIGLGLSYGAKKVHGAWKKLEE
jgi:hypothetical protein